MIGNNMRPTVIVGGGLNREFALGLRANNSVTTSATSDTENLDITLSGPQYQRALIVTSRR